MDNELAKNIARQVTDRILKASHVCFSADNESVCQECCDDHNFDPDEGNLCTECGKDGTDKIAADAYDAYKNRNHDE